ncbi:MAG: Na+/H+ antiporter NhaA, partial [Actinomycetota bacterium]
MSWAANPAAAAGGALGDGAPGPRPPAGPARAWRRPRGIRSISGGISVAGAAVVWLALFESGVHATIAGVVLGLLTPAYAWHHPGQVHHSVTGYLNEERLT